MSTSDTLAIRVLPRREAEECLPRTGEVCVSITNPRQSPAKLNEGWGAVLRLGFHDTDRVGGGFTVMTLADAAALLQFCRKHHEAPLMIHCEWGASRSAAVGLFVAVWFRRKLNLTVDVLAPNPWVLRQLRIAALKYAFTWRDWRLLALALQGPLPSRYAVLPPAIADTY